MSFEPRRRQVVPPTPAERAERDRLAEEARADLEARRAAERPVRELLIGALQGTDHAVRDVEAAAACGCGCHPQISLGAHGGRACSCQLTPDERAARQRSALDALAALRHDTGPDPAVEEVERRAAELGAVAGLAGRFCPFVITGVVDGRAFYLRERHDIWGITIADDADLLTDPWTAPPEAVTWDIAEGSASDFLVDGRFSAARATDMAVDAVRAHLHRRTCDHSAAVAGHRYCPMCGLPRYSQS